MNSLNIFDMLRTLDIQENSSDLEGKILLELAERVAKPDCVFVEIGTWKGESATMLGLIAKKHGGTVYTIDHFMGNKGTGRDSVASQIDLFSIFRYNMQRLELWQNTVKPLVMDSMSANKIFNNNFIDLLFIDADHTYDKVIEDISDWHPKIKDGGIICGHDCQEYYNHSNDFSKEVDENYKTIDCGVSKIFNKQVHFAVIKAVHEYFGESNYKIIKPTSIWVARG